MVRRCGSVLRFYVVVMHCGSALWFGVVVLCCGSALLLLLLLLLLFIVEVAWCGSVGVDDDARTIDK